MPVRGVYAFEEIDDGLPLVPLAARRVLDTLGLKLSLEAWLSLSLEDRCRLVQAGAGSEVDPRVDVVLDRATPRAVPVPPQKDPNPDVTPVALAGAAGPAGPLDSDRWRALGALDRYALAKYAARPEKLARACAEILGVKLTHLTAGGEAHMVGVGEKPETARRAVATACVRTTPEVLAAIGPGAPASKGAASLTKGDVLAAARIAGILAAKRTPELVPLCHPVRTTRAAIELSATPSAASCTCGRSSRPSTGQAWKWRRWSPPPSRRSRSTT